MPRAPIFRPVVAALAAASLIGADVPAAPSAPEPPLTIAFDARGLSSLRWRGAELLADGAIGASWADHVWLGGGIDQPVAADLAATVAVDAERGIVTRTYAWGAIAARYAVERDRLTIDATIADTGARRIAGAQLRLLLLRFPKRVAEYDGRTPMLVTGIDAPAIVRATFGSGRVAICDEGARPLVVGLPWAENHPDDTVMPLVVDTGHRDGQPDSLRWIERPVDPGCVDRYRISLRFGAGDASFAALAGDVERAFVARHPATLAWKDRRPIGTLHCATTVPHSPTNPRGWFNDPTIDTSTEEGRAALAKRLREHVASSIAQLERVGAQGVIVWDIEGQEWPHATSYVGDPRHLPPEMEPVADELFKAYADAGLRTGVTIRPQVFAPPAYGPAQPDQVDVAEDDAAQVLSDKIAYARKRWGCTLFYVDSNVRPERQPGSDHVDLRPLAADVFARVAAKHPDVLLIPEHETPAYWGCAAPYGELRQGFVGTPASVSELYPDAFSVIYVPDCDAHAQHAALVAAAKRGDILLFRSWWPDPINDEVLSVEADARAGAGP